MVRQEFKDYLFRVGFAVLTFIGSLLLVSAFFGAGVLLEILVGLTVEDGTLPHRIFRFVLIVTLIGTALVITSCGAIVVCLAGC